MADEKQLVVFRRIRGKIRPIKISKRQQEALQGSALLGAGVFTGLKLGRLSGIRERQALSRKQLAFDFGTGRAGISAQEGLLPGAKAMQSSFDKLKQSSKFKKAGRIASASAIGLGVEKLLSASGFEQNTFVPEFAAETAGISAAFAVEAGSRKGLTGVKLRSQIKGSIRSDKFRQGTKTGLKKIARFIVGKKLKF